MAEAEAAGADDIHIDVIDGHFAQHHGRPPGGAGGEAGDGQSRFRGTEFIESSLPRIRRLREMLTAKGLGAELKVDGGINAETAPRVVAAGANVLVAGEAIFGAREGIAEGMRRIRESLQTVTER